MGTAIKHPVPDRVKPSFVIFDIRTHSMLYSLLYSYGNSGRQRVNLHLKHSIKQALSASNFAASRCPLSGWYGQDTTFILSFTAGFRHKQNNLSRGAPPRPQTQVSRSNEVSKLLKYSERHLRKDVYPLTHTVAIWAWKKHPVYRHL